MKNFSSLKVCSALCFGMLPGFETSSRAQCSITFSPNPGTATISVESYWAINGFNYSLPAPALFQDVVAVGNSTVPANTPANPYYLGWCIDVPDNIDNGPEIYGPGDVFMYSSCDPNLDAELIGLGATYGFTYPATDTTATPADWNAVNYILNHPASGASYWDVQVAIFNFVGGPSPADPASPLYSFYPGLLNVYHPALAAQMVSDAAANAAAWHPQCGDVIAVILAIIKDAGGNFPAQLTILQIPMPCPLGAGDTATIGFWHNKNGQALIDSLGGGPSSTALANDLASTFPWLYGPQSPNDLTGKPNTAVAALFLKFFSVSGAKTQAQIMAGALAAFATDSTLFGTKAAPYGFNISPSGTGADTFNVGSNGAAIGLKNNTSYTIWQLLQQANLMMQAGTFNANAFNTIFDGINQGGDIK